MNSPKKDVNAREDFLLLVVSSFVVAFAMNLLKLGTFDCVHEHYCSSSDLLAWVSKAIVDKFVGEGVVLLLAADDFSLHYASDTHLRFLYIEFIDSSREGNGSRVHRCLRHFLQIF